MIYRWCALFFACVVASAFQHPAVDAERRADVYAIYSRLLTNPETSQGPDDNEIYFIADTTVPGTPQDPCVRVPSEAAARFAEVMADCEQRKDTPAKLERAFQISKRYRLLNDAEVDQFAAARGSGGYTPRPGEPKVIDLFRLSDVYFDRSRTLALTAISTWCGDLCAQFQWKVLEKNADGHWQERRWVTCAAMAERRGAPQVLYCGSPVTATGCVARIWIPSPY
ncbi:MAG TPA: hypothetical protein VLY24_16460 [Bryobacteraceae bacterium]|nr:hypothetical protein [Bryobacteraceae bacterium]